MLTELVLSLLTVTESYLYLSIMQWFLICVTKIHDEEHLISLPLWNVFDSSAPFILILSQTNPLHILVSYLFQDPRQYYLSVYAPFDSKA
jgi:hypothetical protein